MKRIFTFTTCLFLGIASTFSQNAELVFFTELGEKFTAYLNGQQVNEAPSNRITASDLVGEFFQLRVDFEDASLADFQANVGAEPGMQSTYIIKLNNKGRFVARPFAQAPLGSTTVAEPLPPTRPAEQEIITVREVETAVPAEDVEVTQTVTTTTTTKGSGDGEKINVGVNINGMEMGINMTVPDMDMDTEIESSETSTVTTTTTTRTSTSTTGTWSEEPAQTDVVRPAPVVTGPAGCTTPRTKDEFDAALNSIKSKSFSDTRMTTARQIAKSRCLTSSQVAAIMGIMDFEEDRLEFAKFAYDYTFDQKNYYLVNDSFQFESSIEELDEYLQSR